MAERDEIAKSCGPAPRLEEPNLPTPSRPGTRSQLDCARLARVLSADVSAGSGRAAREARSRVGRMHGAMAFAQSATAADGIVRVLQQTARRARKFDHRCPN